MCKTQAARNRSYLATDSGCPGISERDQNSSRKSLFKGDPRPHTWLSYRISQGARFGQASFGPIRRSAASSV